MVVASGNAEGDHAASEPAANKAEDETQNPRQCALLLHTMGHASVIAELARNGNGMVWPVIDRERTHLTSDDDGRLAAGRDHHRCRLHHGLTWLHHHGLTWLLHHGLTWLLHHWLTIWLHHHWLTGLLHHGLTWLLHHDRLACCCVHGLALRQKILLLWVRWFLAVHLLL